MRARRRDASASAAIALRSTLRCSPASGWSTALVPHPARRERRRSQGSRASGASSHRHDVVDLHKGELRLNAVGDQRLLPKRAMGDGRVQPIEAHTRRSPGMAVLVLPTVGIGFAIGTLSAGGLRPLTTGTFPPSNRIMTVAMRPSSRMRPVENTYDQDLRRSDHETSACIAADASDAWPFEARKPPRPDDNHHGPAIAVPLDRDSGDEQKNRRCRRSCGVTTEVALARARRLSPLDRAAHRGDLVLRAVAGFGDELHRFVELAARALHLAHP